MASEALTTSDFSLAEDPFALFALWAEDARRGELNDPDAMTLATVDADGMPDARMVLCKQVDAGGLVFFSNCESVKGLQLARTPLAAALFHWKSLRRQVRFRGAISSVDDASADAYYHSRARNSQIGAWASAQSRPLESRALLEGRVAEYTQKFGADEIPRPPYWLGYRLAPREIEFWSDGAFRLHDRVRFERDGEGWRRQRLYP